MKKHKRPKKLRQCAAAALLMAFSAVTIHMSNIRLRLMGAVAGGRTADRAGAPLSASPGGTVGGVPTRARGAWKADPSSGIPVGDRGRVVVSMGACCGASAQRAAHPRGGGRSYKPYDVATVLSTSLWLLPASGAAAAAGFSVFVAMVYVGGDDESESALRRLSARLKRVDEEVGGGGRVVAWPYDVSSLPNPQSACVRAAQMGRYFAHESGLIGEDDFVMTTDSDVFPINIAALMPFLNGTNPDGDYRRVFLREWGDSLNGRKSIKLFGVGQTAFDWNRSLAITGANSLKDAIGMVSRYEWGFDQTLATTAIMNGELCYFPHWYRIVDERYRVVSTDASNASEERDEYTCFKGTGPRMECLDSFEGGGKCHYSHFKPEAGATLMRRVHDEIARDFHNRTGALYRTAEELLGPEEVAEARREEGVASPVGGPPHAPSDPLEAPSESVPWSKSAELNSLREELRPGMDYSKCTTSLNGRGCDGDRRPSLPYVTGDLFRCLADGACYCRIAC